jgi:ribosomal-protein-alanine N-acetyltransferase
MSTGWPVLLEIEEIFLRPLRFRDRLMWNKVRAENRDWLSPWEATIPAISQESYKELPSYFEMVRILNREARNGRSFSFAIWHGTNLIGQISLGGVIYGAMRGGHIGYWIDRNFANRGYTTAAVKIITQYAFEVLKLHRVEINLRPENASSRRVAEKAGFIFEGDRPRYLHIDGQWRDHICFVKENSEIK